MSKVKFSKEFLDHSLCADDDLMQPSRLLQLLNLVLNCRSWSCWITYVNTVSIGAFRIELSFIYLLLEALLTFLDFARQFLLLVTRQFCTFMRLLKILRLWSCYHRLIQRRRNPWRKKFFLWRMALLSYAAFRFQLLIIHTVCMIGPVMDWR